MQANAVADSLRNKGEDAEIVPITTTGDSDRSPIGDKSRFVKEIEDALLAGEVDLAVHSAKDVPGTLPDGLTIAAVPGGEDPRDALVGAAAIDALGNGVRIGTSSLRRRAQLLAINPAAQIVPLRGNVDTRLRKLAEGEYDAIVLALAGLRRLGRDGEAGAALDADRFVPAPGQGLLALETRIGDAITAAVAALEDTDARRRLDAERAVVEELEATCYTPVGVHASVAGERITLRAFVGLPDGSEWITDRLERSTHDARSAGGELGRRLLAAGAGELLRRAESTLGQ